VQRPGRVVGHPPRAAAGLSCMAGRPGRAPHRETRPPRAPTAASTAAAWGSVLGRARPAAGVGAVV